MPDMTTIVTKDRRVMAVYKHEIPAEWVKSMKQAGYKVKVKEKTDR